MGHFLNMVLKDMFVKIALLDGKYAKFVPGWDMHGLPIEYETLKHLGINDFHAIDPLELRARCKERALFWLDRQRDQRVRMGNFGLFDRPYRTIDPSFEATIVNALADLADKQQIYKGLRSTLWCVHDETALAEAEIEYETRTSPSIYVRFAANDGQRERLLEAFGAGASGFTGERFVSHLDDDSVDAAGQRSDRAACRREVRPLSRRRRGGDRRGGARAARARRALRRRRTACGALAASGSTVSPCAIRSWTATRRSSWPTMWISKTGTGAVHTAPGHGADDFDTGMKYGLPILNPVDAAGRFTAEAGSLRGAADLRREREDRRRSARVAARSGARASTSTRIRTAGVVTIR